MTDRGRRGERPGYPRATQPPPRQTWSLLQALPQPPQLAGSVAVLTQVPPQAASPCWAQDGAVQAPPLQTPLAQPLPHAPQFAGSLARLAQTFPPAQ